MRFHRHDCRHSPKQRVALWCIPSKFASMTEFFFHKRRSIILSAGQSVRPDSTDYWTRPTPLPKFWRLDCDKNFPPNQQKSRTIATTTTKKMDYRRVAASLFTCGVDRFGVLCKNRPRSPGLEGRTCQNWSELGLGVVVDHHHHHHHHHHRV